MLKVRHDDLERLVPVIFPNELVHLDVEGAICELFRFPCKAVSAGTIRFDNVAVSEGSESLGLRANPDDARTIEVHDYCHGL